MDSLEPHTHKDNEKNLAIFGGFSVSRDSSGSYVTQRHFRDFISEIGRDFDTVTFFAYGKRPPGGYESKLDGICEVVVLSRGTLGAFRKLAQLVEIRKCSHVWLQFPNAMTLWPFLYLLYMSRRNIVCAYLGNDYVQWSEVNYPSNPFLRHLCVRVHEYAIVKSDFVIARGQKLNRMALELGAESHITYPLTRLSSGLCGAMSVGMTRHLLYIGQISWPKGVGILLEALSHLNRKFDDLVLSFVGSGVDLDRAIDYAKTLGVERQTRFYGWVDSPDDIDALWEDAGILVMPSSTYPEGVPRVIDEAISRRRAVVATDVGGIFEEYAKGEVLLVQPNDVDAMVHGLSELCGSVEKCERIVGQGESRRRWLNSGEVPGRQHSRLLLGLKG